jgi:hypothetical protein
MLIPLRPSNEHILIVRVPGARDRHGCHSSFPSNREIRLSFQYLRLDLVEISRLIYATLGPLIDPSRGRGGVYPRLLVLVIVCCRWDKRSCL